MQKCAVIDMNGTTDYLEVETYIGLSSGTPTVTASAAGGRATFFGGFRIGS